LSLRNLCMLAHMNSNKEKRFYTDEKDCIEI